eukprot:scaffold3218_cov99-Isochrysis_galbana.AAC.8
MPPSQSTSLIPLSASGLWLAVTIRPTHKPPRARERSAASMPILKKVESRMSARARKPAVPYARCRSGFVYRRAACASSIGRSRDRRAMVGGLAGGAVKSIFCSAPGARWDATGGRPAGVRASTVD